MEPLNLLFFAYLSLFLIKISRDFSFNLQIIDAMMKVTVFDVSYVAHNQ